MRTNGKNRNNLGWLANPKRQPRTPSISEDWSFVVALCSECTITKMKRSKCPLHPQHSFFYLLSPVEEYTLSPSVLLPRKKSRFGRQKTRSSVFLPSRYSGDEGKGHRSCAAQLPHPASGCMLSTRFKGRTSLMMKVGHKAVKGE